MSFDKIASQNGTSWNFELYLQILGEEVQNFQDLKISGGPDLKISGSPDLKISGSPVWGPLFSFDASVAFSGCEYRRSDRL